MANQTRYHPSLGRLAQEQECVSQQIRSTATDLWDAANRDVARLVPCENQSLIVFGQDQLVVLDFPKE